MITQTMILNHWAYGVYSPTFAATTAPPMLKYPDYRIRECLHFRPDPTTPDRREHLTSLIFVPTVCERRVGSDQSVQGRGRSGKVGSGRKCTVCVQPLRSCGSRNSRHFTHRVAVLTANSDRQCWSHFSTAVYGSKTDFSLPYLKYCSKVQTVSEKKFS